MERAEDGVPRRRQRRPTLVRRVPPTGFIEAGDPIRATPAELRTDAFTSTVLAAGLTSLGLLPSMPRPQVDSLYIDTAIALVVGGAVVKYLMFVCCLFPAMTNHVRRRPQNPWKANGRRPSLSRCPRCASRPPCRTGSTPRSEASRRPTRGQPEANQRPTRGRPSVNQTPSRVKRETTPEELFGNN